MSPKCIFVGLLLLLLLLLFYYYFLFCLSRLGPLGMADGSKVVEGDDRLCSLFPQLYHLSGKRLHFAATFIPPIDSTVIFICLFGF